MAKNIWKRAVNSVYGDLEKEVMKDCENAETETPATEEEWVWVDGYKGTNTDMTCNDFQYELGKMYEMPAEDVEECRSGFHLCLKLEDVFGYYKIGEDHRFFKVRALVRKDECEDYLDPNKKRTRDMSPYDLMWAAIRRRTKLAAKAIVFESECTIDEIFGATDIKDWSTEDKILALKNDIDFVEKLRKQRENEGKVEELIELGYSRAFATYIVENGRYNDAKAIGSQPELSLDVRALLIFRSEL